MSKVNPQKLSAIHQQLSNLKLDLLDTKVLISRQQAAASKFTINIAKDLFKFIDQYKQKQFSQLLQISQCTKRLVDQVLAYKSIHIEQNNFYEFFHNTLPLIDDIFESLTKQLLLLQVKIKDIAVSSTFTAQEEQSKILADMSNESSSTSKNHYQLLENSTTLQKVLEFISNQSRKRDKDFVLELIKRQFSVKDGSKQGEFSLKRHCHNMTLTQMERYVCSLINNSYQKNLPGLPTKRNNNQSKIRYKKDVSLDDILAISNSKVPLTLRLKDWEQASACGDSSSQSTVIDVKSVITGTKSILKLFEQTPAPHNDTSGTQNNKMMFINSKGVEIPYNPKKIKKIQFSGSFKKPRDEKEEAEEEQDNSNDGKKYSSKSNQKDLPFTHSQIDKLVFAQDDTMQLSKAMQDRRKKLLQDDNSSLSQLYREQQQMEESFTVSTGVTGKNVDAQCDKSLASDIDNKFQKFPLDIYGKNNANKNDRIKEMQNGDGNTSLPQKKRKQNQIVKKQNSQASFISDKRSQVDNSFRQKYSKNDEKQMLQKVQRIQTPIKLKKSIVSDTQDQELKQILQLNDRKSENHSNFKKLNDIKKASGKKFNNKQLITIESVKQNSFSSSASNNRISISSRKIIGKEQRKKLTKSGEKVLLKSSSKSNNRTLQLLASSSVSEEHSFAKGSAKSNVFNYQAASFSSSNNGKQHQSNYKNISQHHHQQHLEQNKVSNDLSNYAYNRKNEARDINDLYISNIEDDQDDQQNEEIFQRQLQKKVSTVFTSQNNEIQSKKSLELFSSRNKAYSALGFNSDMTGKSINGESKTNNTNISPRKGKGILKSYMQQQQHGRTTAATSISEQQLPPIESHRTVGLKDKNSHPSHHNPTRVVLEKKLRKIIELQNMSEPQSPKANFDQGNGKKIGVRHPIGYQSERASIGKKQTGFPSTRSSVVGLKKGEEDETAVDKQMNKKKKKKNNQQQKLKQVRIKSKQN